MKRVAIVHDQDGDWFLMVEEGAPVKVYWVDEVLERSKQCQEFTLRASPSALDGLVPQSKEE